MLFVSTWLENEWIDWTHYFVFFFLRLSNVFKKIKILNYVKN